MLPQRHLFPKPTTTMHMQIQTLINFRHKQRGIIALRAFDSDDNMSDQERNTMDRLADEIAILKTMLKFNDLPSISTPRTRTLDKDQILGPNGPSLAPTELRSPYNLPEVPF